MLALLYSIIATTVVSLISLIGIFFIKIKDEKLNKILLSLIGFSAGSMMGGAFLHLLPEAEEELSMMQIGLLILFGFAIFFILERILHWQHCHEGHCHVHTFAYTNLIGDGLHNFLDGIVIAAAFAAGPSVGIATTLAVILHELPQEISDYGVLIYAGFTKKKALFYNFASAILAVIGAIFGSLLANQAAGFVPYFLPIAAGGFIYIAASDLIPELHKEEKLHKALFSFSMFILGIILMWLFKILFE